MKYSLVLTCALASGIFVSLAAAQNSSSSSATTRPLTPKSPIATHHSSAPPSLPVNSTKTSAQLTQLEQQKVKAPSYQPSTVAPKKVAPNSTTAASKSGSAINAPYRKPQATRKN